MQLGKNNFGIAKALKSHGNPESKLYSLHITKDKTEITNGHFVIQTAHSEQMEFEFMPEVALDVRLTPDDAINIASSLGKEEYVKAVLPAPDKQSVQVEFDTGEIRILPTSDQTFPVLDKIFPKDPVRFSIAISSEYLTAILGAFKSANVDCALFEFRGSEAPVVIRPATQAENPVVQAVIAPMKTSAVVDLPNKSTTKTKNTLLDEEESSSPRRIQ